jgi:peptidylprolyl isomerase
VRKIPAALAVLGLATVGLAGCSLPGSTDCSRSTPEAGQLDLVEVTGSTDAPPEVEVYTPFHARELAFVDVEAGDGPAITSESQLVLADVSLISGETGETVVSTAYDGDPSQVRPVSQWTQIIPGFEDALHCAAEGSRVAVALSPDDIEAETAASLGLAEDESAIAVIDLQRVYLSAADGALQFNTGTGLPSVVRAPDGRPGVIVPDGAPPEDLVVQTLKKGDGPVVTGDVPVRVHYTGVTWADREVFDSSWDTQAASLSLDAVVPGFAEALEGQTVGSQVLAVIPPDQGYGDQEQGSIPAGSTLVFVIDILGLDEAAAR